jgi:hypothetical protein
MISSCVQGFNAQVDGIEAIETKSIGVAADLLAAAFIAMVLVEDFGGGLYRFWYVCPVVLVFPGILFLAFRSPPIFDH